jgi:hypothetical protein
MVHHRPWGGAVRPLRQCLDPPLHVSNAIATNFDDVINLCVSDCMLKQVNYSRAQTGSGRIAGADGEPGNKRRRSRRSDQRPAARLTVNT